MIWYTFGSLIEAREGIVMHWTVVSSKLVDYLVVVEAGARISSKIVVCLIVVRKCSVCFMLSKC